MQALGPVVATGGPAQYDPAAHGLHVVPPAQNWPTAHGAHWAVAGRPHRRTNIAATGAHDKE